MSIKWPIPSEIGEIYNHVDTNTQKTYSWVWNGKAWMAVGTESVSIPGFYNQSEEPTSDIVPGSFWLDIDTLILYAYLSSDRINYAWIQIN